MRTRDQERAIFAYQRVKDVEGQLRDAYKGRVRGLGPLVMRSGLVTALSVLQRDKKEGDVKALFGHLARARIPGLEAEEDRAAEQLCDQARELDLEGTMLATRELLKVTLWLKRAAEALFDKEG